MRDMRTIPEIWEVWLTLDFGLLIPAKSSLLVWVGELITGGLNCDLGFWSLGSCLEKQYAGRKENY